MTALDNLLVRLDACEEAREWAKTQKNLVEAWQNCKRSDWMIWLIGRSTVDRNDPKLRLMACDFADAVLHLVPAGETRPAEAIRVARLFAAGQASREDMAAARDAAGAAAGAAARDAAWDAAWAAAWDAAGAAARDAAGAAARDAAWAAARDAAWDAAWDAQSDIIRKYYPEAPKIKRGTR